jgi:uncharacterized membrane protein YGL010W
MRTLTEQLTQYAAYHRDPRNIATHFIGVPMIVLAVVVLLSRPAFAMLGGLAMSPALLVAVVVCLFYLKLDLRMGAAMAVVLAAMLALGQWLATQSTVLWVSSGVGMFVVGWIIQFIGHHYEGRKPAFVDDIMGLLIGPLFVMAEGAFALKLRWELQAAIEANVGPVRLRETGSAAV